MKLTQISPLVMISFFYALSLLIRFIFQLEGVGLSVLDAINDIVKVALSTGIAWLILKNTSVPTSKKNFLKIEVIIGLFWVISSLYFDYLDVTGHSTLFGVMFLNLYVYIIRWSVPIVLTARHYSLKDLRPFMKDIGLSIPTLRVILTWTVTLFALFSLILIGAGENRIIFFQSYARFTVLADFPWERRLNIVIFGLVAEELFFRVFLQTRFENYISVGWAILIQSLLFNLVHIPGDVVSFGWGWGVLPLSAFVLLPCNGLIGGFLWYKTRNLPVLVLYHLTIYPLLPLVFFSSYHL